jgi:hypothetical protein
MHDSDFPEIAFHTSSPEALTPARNPVATALASICRQAGVEGCALIEASIGAVHSSNGHTRGNGSAWEAATDYWRLYHRQQRHFAPWGPLRAAVLVHAGGTIGVLPCCDQPPLVVVVSARGDGVDWEECERLTRALGAALRSLLDRPLVETAAG